MAYLVVGSCFIANGGIIDIFIYVVQHFEFNVGFLPGKIDWSRMKVSVLPCHSVSGKTGD